MPSNEPTRCILLTPPRQANGKAARPKLHEHWEVTRFDDALLAMAELAICERAEVARSAWGLQRAARVVLAIDKPAACPHVDMLLAAVKRYLPTVKVWNCAGEGTEARWHAGTKGLDADGDVCGEPSVPSRHRGSGPLPPAHKTPRPSVADATDAPPVASPSAQRDTSIDANLTREEVNMLLEMGDSEP